jgi:hypothetical protein
MKLKPWHWLVVLLSLTAAALYGSAQTTIGVTNPSIYQTNIDQTICVSGWTATVRPPVAYTNKLKSSQLPKGADLKDYEEDHFIPIEIGGSPTDPKNLWPQPYPDARHKDLVENFLHRQVCNHSMTLKQAQQEIYDWKTLYASLSKNYGAISVDDTDPDDI